MEIERTGKSDTASSSGQLPALNRAFKRAMQEKNFAECERLKAEIDAALDKALRVLRLR